MLNAFITLAAIDPCPVPAKSFLSFPTWYQYLGRELVADKCSPVVNISTSDLTGLLPIGLALIEILLRIAGYAAIIFIVYGGFKYITSQGDPDRAKEARSTIVNSLIGLVITIVATALVSYIGRSLIT